MPSYRTDTLKQKLAKRFGDKLSFVNAKARNESTLVFADVSKGDLIESLVGSSRICAEEFVPAPTAPSTTSTQQDVFHCTAVIQSDVMAVKSTMSWPPDVYNDFTDEEVSMIPSSLCNVLAWIIDGVDMGQPIPQVGGDRVSVHSADTKRKILAIAQDILYSTRRGHLKTPKHVLLPIAVHHLTRSAQVVDLLHKFCHGMSRSQGQEVDTALAEQVMSNEDRVPIPSNIDRVAPMVFAADNNDLLEETPTGANTTHCTNSIVIQRAPATAALPPAPRVHLQTRHWRSLQALPAVPAADYIAGN